MIPSGGWYLAIVLLVQCLASFAVWVGYGLRRHRRLGSTRVRIDDASPARRVVGGAAMLLYGAVVLSAGLCVVQAFGGLGPSCLRPWAWAVVTVAGLEFVRAQMVAVTVMMAAAYHVDTLRRAQSSMIQTEEEPEP